MTSSPDSSYRKTDRKPLRQIFWAAAEKYACIIFRHSLRIKSADITETALDLPALILAPHADDETLGCGGIIALKRQAGTHVVVAVATDGSASHKHEKTLTTSTDALVALRKKETQNACMILGVGLDDLKFFDFEDGALQGLIPELHAAISDLIRETQPREIYVCAHRDGHPDHVALATAARLAVRDLADRQAIKLFEYPVWSFDFRSWRHADKRNTTGFLLGALDMVRDTMNWRMRSVMIGSVVHTKAKALTEHQSQLGLYPSEPHWSGLPTAFLRHFQSNVEVFRDVPTDTDAQE
jgi:LmbE family N-acetylglucosaminyl deacetylase